MKTLYTTFLLSFALLVSLHAQTNLATNGANALASGELTGGEAALLFDGDTSTGWVITPPAPQWVQYDLGTPIVVDGYAMHFLGDSLPAYQPTSWTFEGSNDGSSWTVLDDIADNIIFVEWEQFMTGNTIAYRYYRLNISASGADTLAFGEWQLYAIELPTVATGVATWVDSDMATCSGNVLQTGGSPILQRGICYNTTGNPTLANSWRTSSAGIGSFTTLLTSLTPNTTYYFRAFATNALGTSYGSTSGTFTTHKLDQTITFDVLSDRTYGDADVDPGATASSALTVSYTSSNTDVAEILFSQVHIIGAGTTTITAMQNGNASYNAATPVQHTLTVNKKSLTATADNAEREYGVENPYFTVSYSGFITGDNEGNLDTPPAASSTATATSDVGSYFINVSGGSDNNYVFSYIAGYLTVSRAPLDLIVSNAEREYGDENPEFNWIYSGFRNEDDITDLDALPEANTTATILSDVGEYPVTLVSGGDNNYEFVITEGTLEITKAPLTVAPASIARAYGQPNPEFTCLYTGFKNADDASVLDTLPEMSSTASITSEVGEYPITATVHEDTNYELSSLTGTLTVEQAFLNASVDNVTRNEGEANPDFVILYTGFVNGDDSEDIDVPPSATCIANESSAPGNYAIEVSGGSDDNYFILTYDALLTVLELPDAVHSQSETQLRIYPNPVQDILHLEGSGKGLRLQLVNLNGSIVMDRTVSGNEEDISSLPGGFYLLRVLDQNTVVFTEKIFKE